MHNSENEHYSARTDLSNTSTTLYILVLYTNSAENATNLCKVLSAETCTAVM